MTNQHLEKLAWNDKYWTSAKERVDAATDKNGRIWILTTLFTIDTVVGLYGYLILVLKFRVEDIQGFRPVFDEADVPEDVVALDFDATIGVRYRDRKIGSATEAMFIDWADHRPELGISVAENGREVIACAVPAMMPVLRMLRRNNETGYLKNSEYQFSFAWLMRKIEHLQQEDESFEEHHGAWLGQMISVIEYVFKALAEKKELDLEGFRAVHADIVRDLSFGEKVKSADEYVLTLPGYLVALHTLGIHPDDVRGEHGIFRAAFDDCKRIRAEAEADAERLFADIFRGRGGHRSHEAPWGQVLVVRSDNQNATGFLFEKFTRVNLIIAVTSRGHAAFMPRDGAGIVLDAVAERVIAREKDRWRYMKFGKKWLLLNGGSKVRFLVKPTSLSPDELAELAVREITLTEKAKNRLAKGKRKEREAKAAPRS